MAELGKSSNLLNLITRFFSKKIRTAYYSARESIGEHKREIVVHQVKQACVSLQETRDEFEDALERFKNLVCVNESGLEHKYNLLNRQYQFCCSKSDAVRSKIQPVLAAFKDQVLYLKHNLNARAIAALQHEFIAISIDISQLIHAMEQTIAEASQFVSALVDQKTIDQKTLPGR